MTVEQFFGLSHEDRRQVKDMFPNRPLASGSKPTGVVKGKAPKAKAGRFRKVEQLIAEAQRILASAIQGRQTEAHDPSPDEDDSEDGSDYTTEDGSGHASEDGSEHGSEEHNHLVKRNGVSLIENRQVIPQNALEGQIGKSFPSTSNQRPKGIRNRGYNCYRNALLQCLLHTPEFYHLLGNVHKSCAKQPDQCVTCALQRFFQDYWNAPRDSDVLDKDNDILDMALKNVVTEDEAIQQNQQSCPYDLLFTLIRFMEWDAFGTDPNTEGYVSQRYDNTDPDSFTIPSVFNMEYDSYWKCSECGEEKPAVTEYDFGLKIPIFHERRNGDTIEQYIKDSRSNPFRERSEIRCESKGCQLRRDQQAGYVAPERTTFRAITRAPEILVVRLNRMWAMWNRETERLDAHKLIAKISYGETLDLTEYSAYEIDDIRYRLRGVVSHLGTDIQSGHFTAGLRCRGTANTCCKVDDRNVSTPTGDANVLLNPRVGQPYVLIYSRL